MARLITDIKNRARGLWGDIIFPKLGIDIPGKGKHGPCPVCGGTDRFHYIDDHDDGNWHCRHCDMEYGDGLDLVSLALKTTSTEAAKRVGEIIGADTRSPDKPARQEASDSQKPAPDIAAKVAAMSCKTTPKESLYLAGKGLTGLTPPTLPDGKIFLTLVDVNGAICGAQTIAPDGAKSYLKGTRKKGAFIAPDPLPEAPETIIIAEGIATAISAGILHSGAVVAALDAGNLKPVALALRGRYPKAKIIIAADNDYHAPGELDEHGKPKRNAGKISGEEAAAACGGWLALPPGEAKTDWNDYHQLKGVEAAKAAFNASLKNMGEEPEKTASYSAHLNLDQMSYNQVGDILIERYNNNLALNTDNWTVYHYSGVIWSMISDDTLSLKLAKIFRDSDCKYSKAKITAIIETMKLALPELGKPRRELIGFNNGVFDIHAKAFRAHNKEDWLLFASSKDYSPMQQGESLDSNAPNFMRWLNHASASNNEKTEAILAALYMILANRYDWQLFLEITGDAGSGKSMFANIATMLAGKGNTVSASMKALEDGFERALLVDASLIIMPDMNHYQGEGAALKSITGGDDVMINHKYGRIYSAPIRAVILAVNNRAMTFSDTGGGIARRRVIFNFSEVVPENKRDPRLTEKIEAETGFIIRYLMNRFNDEQEAKSILIRQRKSLEALEIKRQVSPLVDFCGYLVVAKDGHGMSLGNMGVETFRPRRYLYHAYVAYMRAQNLDKHISAKSFGEALRSSLAEYGIEYRTHRHKTYRASNVTLSEDASEWLPAIEKPS
ncbi:toprim domain-containing protein [Salmonella enterica]|nr:toprim domain-containing protein [Salmonella enterica]ELN0712158.1 toprim domain-containing protein [Salmonella enterica]